MNAKKGEDEGNGRMYNQPPLPRLRGSLRARFVYLVGFLRLQRRKKLCSMRGRKWVMQIFFGLTTPGATNSRDSLFTQRLGVEDVNRWRRVHNNKEEEVSAHNCSQTEQRISLTRQHTKATTLAGSRQRRRRQSTVVSRAGSTRRPSTPGTVHARVRVLSNVKEQSFVFYQLEFGA